VLNSNATRTLQGLLSTARQPPVPPRSVLPIDLGESVSVDEKSEKFQLFRYCSAQSGFPMRASDNSVGGNADRVAKIQVGNRALNAAQGRLRR